MSALLILFLLMNVSLTTYSMKAFCWLDENESLEFDKENALADYNQNNTNTLSLITMGQTTINRLSKVAHTFKLLAREDKLLDKYKQLIILNNNFYPLFIIKKSNRNEIKLTSKKKKLEVIAQFLSKPGCKKLRIHFLDTIDVLHEHRSFAYIPDDKPTSMCKKKEVTGVQLLEFFRKFNLCVFKYDQENIAGYKHVKFLKDNDKFLSIYSDESGITLSLENSDKYSLCTLCKSKKIDAIELNKKYLFLGMDSHSYVQQVFGNIFSLPDSPKKKDLFVDGFKKKFIKEFSNAPQLMKDHEIVIFSVAKKADDFQLFALIKKEQGCTDPSHFQFFTDDQTIDQYGQYHAKLENNKYSNMEFILLRANKSRQKLSEKINKLIIKRL